MENNQKITSIRVDPFGNEHKSFCAMCEFYGQTKNSVFRRMTVNGMSLRDALLLPRRNKRRGIPFVVNGKEFKGIYEALKYYGISNGKFYGQMKRKGLSYEETLEMLTNADKAK